MLTKYIGVNAVALAKIELLLYRELKKLQDATCYWTLSCNLFSEPDNVIIPLFISGFDEYFTALSAMLSHHSQMVWYRWLYVGWSRYMWINTWKEIRNFS